MRRQYCHFHRQSSRRQQKPCWIARKVQEIEDSSSEVGFHEGEVLHDAFDLELGSSKEEPDYSELSVVYIMSIGEKRRKNLPLESSFMVITIIPAIPNPMRIKLGVVIDTLIRG